MGTLSYLAYGSLIQDIVLYNLPQHSNLGSCVAILYMLNIIGSITMTIQPIYGLFEKKVKDKEEDLQEEPAQLQRDSVESQTETSTVILNDDVA